MVRSYHIVNHAYHVDRVLDPDARFIVFGPKIDDVRVVFTADLLEPQRLADKLCYSKKWVIRRAQALLAGADRVYFWGVQDALSYKLLRSQPAGREILVVPDNNEFFLRFSNLRRLSPRAFAKAAVYGLLTDAVRGAVREHCGRFVYSVPKTCKIDTAHAYFRLAGSFEAERKENGNYITFISQPYYRDHLIDEERWGVRVADRLSHYQVETGMPVRILYHHRDSATFRARMATAGFVGARHPGHTCIGIFSTMLFELARANFDVYIAFDDFEDLFERDYVAFVRWFLDRLNMDGSGRSPITASPEDFYAILPVGSYRSG